MTRMIRTVAGDKSPSEQADVDREQWRQIDLNRLLIWFNIAITLIGLAGLADDLRFWHDQMLVPAGTWLKHNFAPALIPFEFIYVTVEWWRWAVHGFFDLIELDLPRTLQSLIGIYVFLGNTTLLILRGNVTAKGRTPYARTEFLKGIVVQLFYISTIAKWLFARPRWHEEYVKYFIDAVFCVVIWASIGLCLAAFFVSQFDLAKGSLLAILLSVYGIILSDGLYVGSTRWYTVLFLGVVAMMYVVNSVYGVCCVT